MCLSFERILQFNLKIRNVFFNCYIIEVIYGYVCFISGCILFKTSFVFNSNVVLINSIFQLLLRPVLQSSKYYFENIFCTGEENGDQEKDRESEDDDLLVVGEEDDDPQEGSSSKRRKINPPEEDNDLCIVDS